MSRSCKTCKYYDPANMLARCILCRPEMKDWEPKDRNQAAQCETCRHEEKSAFREPCISCGITWPGSSSHWEPKEELIDEQPDAQPTQTNAESTQDFGRDTNVPSTDCISRQAVIDLLKQMRKDGDMVPWEGKDVFARIRKLPAAQTDLSSYSDKLWRAAYERGKAEAQPQRMMGRWIPDNLVGGGYWVCTACKHPTEAFAADVLYKFCPFCGSEMRGEADEQP